MSYFLAGVATAELFAGDQLFSVAKTLIDSSITIGVSSEDIRGGEGAKLFGKYYHTSTFDAKFTDAMFKLEYIAKNVGSNITVGGDGTTTETVTLLAGGNGAVIGTPVDFAGYGTIGWVALPNSDTWTKVTFTGQAFAVPGAAINDVYCVKYVKNNAAGRKLIVSANIIPDTIRVEMTASLFSGDSSNLSAATKIGVVKVIIPRFILNGSTELTMNMTGASQTPLSGSALANDSATCTSSAYYAEILEVLDSVTWKDLTNYLAVSDSDIDITHPGTQLLDVYAIPFNGLSFKPAVADLTFTSTVVGKATVSAAGLVTSVASGSTDIIVTVAGYPNLQAVAVVTVS